MTNNYQLMYSMINYQPVRWIDLKQLLLDEVFVISGIMKVEVRVISVVKGQG